MLIACHAELCAERPQSEGGIALIMVDSPYTISAAEGMVHDGPRCGAYPYTVQCQSPRIVGVLGAGKRSTAPKVGIKRAHGFYHVATDGHIRTYQVTAIRPSPLAVHRIMGGIGDVDLSEERDTSQECVTALGTGRREQRPSDQSKIWFVGKALPESSQPVSVGFAIIIHDGDDLCGRRLDCRVQGTCLAFLLQMQGAYARVAPGCASGSNLQPRVGSLESPQSVPSLDRSEHALTLWLQAARPDVSSQCRQLFS